MQILATVSGESWKPKKHFFLIHTGKGRPPQGRPPQGRLSVAAASRMGMSRSCLHGARKGWGGTGISSVCCAWAAPALLTHKSSQAQICGVGTWQPVMPLLPRKSWLAQVLESHFFEQTAKFLQSGSCFKHLPGLWRSLSWEHDLCCPSHDWWEAQPQQDTQDCTHRLEPRILFQAQRLCPLKANNCSSGNYLCGTTFH